MVGRSEYRTTYFLIGCMLIFQGCLALNKDVVLSLQEENKNLHQQMNALAAEKGQLKSEQSVLKRQYDELQSKLLLAENEYKSMKQEQEQLKKSLEVNVKEADSLQKAKGELETKLRTQLDKLQAKLEMTERGLVLSFLAEVLFDSGSAEIKTSAYDALNSVSETLQTTTIESRVAIEGHTDNDPIRFSNWESNWELSAARALSVLHYFVEERRVKPERLCAIAYGEFHPRADNETKVGKRENRRVEIVISPHLIKEPFQK